MAPETAQPKNPKFCYLGPMPETEALNSNYPQVWPFALASPPPVTEFVWSPVTRIAFRFAFCYLLLYCSPAGGRINLLAAIPFSDYAQPLLEAPFRALCPWVATNVFHLSGAITRYHPTGSGDTTLDYVQFFCFVAISAIATILWSLLDRRRLHYRTLYPWLRLFVRFTLAFTMLGYGFAKTFPLQFPAPDLSRLTETYGESSPMGLLWTFMGASTSYQMFCGFAEVVSGMLLLFRRTSTLGAMFAFGVLSNIVALNYCFDVPVKLYSSNLLLITGFLLLPDARALWSFFVLRRQARLSGVWIPRFERLWLHRSALALQILVVSSVLFQNIKGSYDWSRQVQRESADASPLYGIWTVEEPSTKSVGNSFTATPVPFRRLAVGRTSRIGMRMADDTLQHFALVRDHASGKYKLAGWRNHHTGEFSARILDADSIRLQGAFDGKPVDIRLRRSKIPEFILKTRGFHWISEDPYNV